MIVALFANIKKRQSIEIAKGLCAYLAQKGVTVVAEDDEAHLLNIHQLTKTPLDQINFLISMGGDGTILRVIHRLPTLDVPILGINLGALGFMADVPLSDLYPSLDDLVAGSYSVEERITMIGSREGGKDLFAVNDMVVHRGRNPSLIDLAIHVDGRYFNTFSADGVIVATPNGSTAYSLASGGPILTPELKAFVLTPISAHTISNRPIVLMPQRSIEIEYLSPYDPIDITYDGFTNDQLKSNDIFTIRPGTRTFKMIKLERNDYFSTLRSKLGWAGQVRGLRPSLTS